MFRHRLDAMNAFSARNACGPSARVVDGKNRKPIVYVDAKESPPEIEIALDGTEEDKSVAKS